MTEQPNILWIYCDELRADALACYAHGDVQLHTPHLDALAASGVRFSNSFCNSPVCVASRTSTMTGLYPQQTGVYHNEAAWPGYELPADYMTFPQWLAQHGYRTADFGKVHLARGLQPWDLQIPDGGGMRGYEAATDVITPPGVQTTIGGRYPGDRPYPAEQVTDNAVDWLRAQDNAGPWLLRASYLQPHTPVFPPPPYDRMYADAGFSAELTRHGLPSAFERRFAAILEAERMPAAHIRLAREYYHGLVAWVDAQVGRLLATLAALGLRQNTLVVFGADHGASLGENGCYAKHLFAPASHRVPLILSWPGTLAGGRVDEGICEGLDLARTCCEAAGIAAHPQFQGRSLLSAPPPEAVHGVIGYGHPQSRAYPNLRRGDWHDGRGWPRRACIRTQQYRLDLSVRQDGAPVPATDTDAYLADWQSDATESRNLAADPAHAATLADLTARLHTHLADSIEPDLDALPGPCLPRFPQCLKIEMVVSNDL